MLARSYDLVRFEKLNIKNMTRSARGTTEQPGKQVKQKAGLNRAILAHSRASLEEAGVPVVDSLEEAVEEAGRLAA